MLLNKRTTWYPVLKSADREGCGRRGRKRERGDGESKKKVYQRHTKKKNDRLNKQTRMRRKSVERVPKEPTPFFLNIQQSILSSSSGSWVYTSWLRIRLARRQKSAQCGRRLVSASTGVPLKPLEVSGGSRNGKERRRNGRNLRVFKSVKTQMPQQLSI